MAKVKLAGLNIKVHPHNDEDIYSKLLTDAFKERKEFRARGDQYLILQSVQPYPSKKECKFLIGKIARFTTIDPKLPWFNFKTNDQAVNEDLSELNIPPFLRANYAGFYYVFDFKKHRLAFEIDNGETTLSPMLVKNYFERLFELNTIVQKYGEVDVNIIHDDEKLKDILEMHSLQKLEFEINRPNPDDNQSDYTEVINRLNSLHAKRLDVSIKAIKGQSIKPDAEIKKYARIAADNGEVRGDGYDERGKKLELSTQEHPKEESGFHDPKSPVHREAIVISIAERFFRSRS